MEPFIEDNGTGALVEINVQVPEDIVRELGSDTKSVERALLEGLALEGIRSGRLSRGQARRLLGLPTRYDLDGFLKSHGVAIEENVDSVLADSKSILSLGHR